MGHWPPAILFFINVFNLHLAGKPKKRDTPQKEEYVLDAKPVRLTLGNC